MIHIPFQYVKKLWESFKLMLNYKKRYDDKLETRNRELAIEERRLQLEFDKMNGTKYCHECRVPMVIRYSVPDITALECPKCRCELKVKN